jgi:DNA-binding response OmpR family regulator
MAPRSSPPPGPQRVLVIDDERSLANAAAFALRRAGFEVETAFDGVEGLREAVEGGYDAILLDLGLPELDGLGVLAGLRARGVTTPVIVCSNSSRASDHVQAKARGAAGFLIKAETPLSKLVEAVRDVLG